MIDGIIGTVSTGAGHWNALLWVIAAFVAVLLAYILFRMGNPTYNRGTEQTKPFISGWKEIDKHYSHIPGGNVYWGIREALKDYYAWMKDMHSGIVNDYMSWFVLVTAIIMIIIVIAGGA